MCKIGDIIIVRKYKDHGKTISSHSFVVINDENGEIQGLHTISLPMYYLLLKMKHRNNEKCRIQVISQLFLMIQ